MALHISIVAEPIFYIGSIPISNSIFTSWLVTAAIIILAIKFYRSSKSLTKPTGLQNLLEMIVESFYNLCNSITQNDLKTSVILPIPLAAFIWILLNNWVGLMPGVGPIVLHQKVDQIESSHSTSLISTSVFAAETTTEPTPAASAETETAVEEEPRVKLIPLLRPGTADLNTTIALALISVGATQVIGIKYLGRSYWSRFFNLNGIFSFVGILEFVGEITKIISFAFRLFGNIFAGEVLILVITFLIPILVPVPFISLEIFVGIIQAFVFAILTIVFMNMATVHSSTDH